MDVLNLIKEHTTTGLTFINTVDFVEEVKGFLSQGASMQVVKDYIMICKNFDIFGNDLKTDYSNVVMLYDKPRIHEFFKKE